MRKKIILSLLLIFVFFSISSSQLLIKNPNWKNGEKFSYEIRYKDELVGSQDYLITDTLIEKTKAYQIKVATLTGYQSQNTFDSVSLIINQGNLKPLILERMIMTPQMFIKVQAIYLADKVKVKMKVAGKEVELVYQKNKPNLMVKYLDNAGGTVMTLKEYK